MIEPEEFEGILDDAVKRLNTEVRENAAYHDPQAFEKRVLEALQETAEGRGITTPSTK